MSETYTNLPQPLTAEEESLLLAGLVFPVGLLEIALRTREQFAASGIPKKNQYDYDIIKASNSPVYQLPRHTLLVKGLPAVGRGATMQKLE